MGIFIREWDLLIHSFMRKGGLHNLWKSSRWKMRWLDQWEKEITMTDMHRMKYRITLDKSKKSIDSSAREIMLSDYNILVHILKVFSKRRWNPVSWHHWFRNHRLLLSLPTKYLPEKPTLIFLSCFFQNL